MCVSLETPARTVVTEQVTYLVTKQSVVYHCNVKRCITRDNIPILVRVTLMLRVMGDAEKGEDPSLVRTFVHEVGVRGLESQLVNAVVRGWSPCFSSARCTASSLVRRIVNRPSVVFLLNQAVHSKIWSVIRTLL